MQKELDQSLRRQSGLEAGNRPTGKGIGVSPGLRRRRLCKATTSRSKLPPRLQTNYLKAGS